MTRHALALALTAVVGTAAIALPAHANTLRWAATGDSLTLDPHSQNESPTHTMSHQIYDSLIFRDTDVQLQPGLATEWAPTADPTVWAFKLREGVTFHDGAAFDASDVVFSINRAKHPNSDMKELLTSIIEVKAVDTYTVHFVTEGPNPLLPNSLTNLFMMDEGWAHANGAAVPQNFEAGEENFATRNANGTGPFRVVTREPGVRTILEKNPDSWAIGIHPMEIDEVVFTPIQSSATRVAALLSGEIDFMQEVPVQDLERIAAADGLKIASGPQNRVIFFGLNVGDADLEWDNVEGKNPLADVRVRRAMNTVINREAIRQVVMRGQSIPAGMIAPPFVNGWSDLLDATPSWDVAAAQELMTEAGYADGFEITLHCTNDRYVNDEGLCQAVVGMLGRIGIDVNLDARTKAIHFQELPNKELDFYLLGWGVPTFDSEYIFNFLVHTSDDERGSWNATRYSNPALDAKIRQLPQIVDLDRRNRLIQEIWQQMQEDVIYLPIHHQVVNFAMREDIVMGAQAENQPQLMLMRFGN